MPYAAAFKTKDISMHTKTNIYVIEKFLEKDRWSGYHPKDMIKENA